MGARNHSTWQGYGRKYSVTCDHHPLKSRFGIKDMISVVCNPTVCVVCVCLHPDTAPEGSTSDQSLVCFTSLFLINHRNVQLKDFLSVSLSC